MKDEILNPCSFRNTLEEWIDTATGRNNQRLGEDPKVFYSNYVELTNNTKIRICDSIITLASSVFGPQGGYWAKSIGDPNNPVTDAQGIIKSKDGNEFFKKITFVNSFAQLFLVNVQGYTRYIADLQTKGNETSKDGTTSTAMLGAAFTKFLLTKQELNRVSLDKNRQRLNRIPSTMYNLMFDILKEEGTKLLEEKVLPIYDYNTKSYIKDYKKYAINALETTTDSDPILMECFTNAIEDAEKHHYDIIGSVEGAPQEVYGTPKLEIKFLSGVQLKANGLDPNINDAFSGKQMPVFILDGYISDYHIKFFISAFKRFVESMYSQPEFYTLKTAQDGLPTVDMPITPLFIMTRVSDAMKRSLEALLRNGISIKSPLLNQMINIKPRFLVTPNEDENAAHFQDIKEIFKASIINLDAMNNYLLQTRKDEFFNKETHSFNPIDTARENVSIHMFFPAFTKDGIQSVNYTIDSVKAQRTIGEDIVEYRPVTIHTVPAETKSVKLQYEGTMYPLINPLFDLAYDGLKLRLSPISLDVENAVVSKRDELLKMVEEASGFAVIDGIDERINMLTAMTQYPVITYMTDSQKSQLLTLYQDANGIFASVHKHGVCPGANTFFIKNFKELNKRVIERMTECVQNVGESKKDLYIKSMEEILDALWDAYVYVYSFIDDEYEDNIKEYTDNKELPFLHIYNSVSGRYEDKIIESARSTRDIFLSMLNIAKDAILIRHIDVQSRNNLQDSILASSSLTFHPINLKYASEEIQEKYKHLMEVK